MSRRSTSIKVRVFREPSSLLSRLAHDVELRLERYQVDESTNQVVVSFEPESLVVEGALVNGALDHSLLKASDRVEIERNLRKQVLKTREHPQAAFTGRFERVEDRVELSGSLELMGVNHDVAWQLTRHGDRYRGHLVLTPSRWGIAPYRALLGALKLQDRVEVWVEVAAEPSPG